MIECNRNMLPVHRLTRSSTSSALPIFFTVAYESTKSEYRAASSYQSGSFIVLREYYKQSSSFALAIDPRVYYVLHFLLPSPFPAYVEKQGPSSAQDDPGSQPRVYSRVPIPLYTWITNSQYPRTNRTELIAKIHLPPSLAMRAITSVRCKVR